MRHGGYSFSTGNLTQGGIEVVQSSIRALSNKKKYVIFTSPVKRAKQTAQIVSDFLDQPEVIIIPELNTINVYSVDQLKKKISGHFLQNTSDLILIGHYELGRLVRSISSDPQFELTRGELCSFDWKKIKKQL